MCPTRQYSLRDRQCVIIAGIKKASRGGQNVRQMTAAGSGASRPTASPLPHGSTRRATGTHRYPHRARAATLSDHPRHEVLLEGFNTEVVSGHLLPGLRCRVPPEAPLAVAGAVDLAPAQTLRDRKRERPVTQDREAEVGDIDSGPDLPGDNGPSCRSPRRLPPHVGGTLGSEQPFDCDSPLPVLS